MNESTELERRKLEEIAFHDKLREGENAQRWSPEAEDRLASDPMWSNFKYYAIEKESLDFRQRWIDERIKGARVLDYCSGNGLEAIAAGKAGAKSVLGIDISPVSISNCQAQAKTEGIDHIVDFQVMDAENMPVPDNAYDLIIEYGVLHHLDLDRGMAELARVLTPDGVMICTETLGHNPLIRRYRQQTPHLRTAWEAEHILTAPSFDIIRKHFGTIEMQFFHLATLAAVPFRRTPLFSPMVSALRVVDRLLFAIPGIRWQAWQVVFRLSNPRKHV
jgi:ubiquinone/menaquinone biosynthesis C-methylase UbiE